jgi:phosphoglycerate dehydrogenase-like enzyme
MLHAHILQKPEPGDLEFLLKELDDQIRLTFGAEMSEGTGFQILVAGRPERKHILASSELRALIIPWAGIPESTRELMKEFPGIRVHNLHHNAAPTAELAVALLMGAAKFLVPFDRTIRNDDWRPRYRPNPAVLLEGKMALILGFGEIGQRVGRVCQALAMRVHGIRRHPEHPLLFDMEAKVHPLGSLKMILPQANALILCLPLTPQTQGLIGEEELALMPEGGILINVGRGPVVDQRALYSALKNGSLRAAGLDVWYNYPKDEESRISTPPADYPFQELDNVVMSPHRGGGSIETGRLRLQHLAASLNAAARGLPVPNPVNMKEGY